VQTLAFSPHCAHLVVPGIMASSPFGWSNGIQRDFAPIDGAFASSGASSSLRPLLRSLTSSSHSPLSPIIVIY